MRTRESAPAGVTVHRVTSDEPRSDSVMTRPGSGSSTRKRRGARGPPRLEREAEDRARPDAALLDLEVRERRREELLVMMVHVGDERPDDVGRRPDRALLDDAQLAHQATSSAARS